MRRRSLPSRWSEALLAAHPWKVAGAVGWRAFERRTTRSTDVLGLEVVGGAAEGQRCWLKVYRREPSDARREFTWLRAAAGRLGVTHGPSVATALAWLRTIGGVVTAHIEGPSLTSQLDDESLNLARRQELCREAGTLLALLHGTPAADGDDDAFDFSAVLGAIHREMRVLPVELRRRLVVRLDRLAEGIAPAARVLRPGHGDFAPFNLIVARRGLVAIDPSFHRAFPRPGGRSTVAEDLGRFLSCLRGIRAGSFLDPDRLRRQAAFFAGYRAAGGMDLSPESPAVRVMFTYFLLVNLRDWGGGKMHPAGRRNGAAVLRLWLDELEAETDHR